MNKLASLSTRICSGHLPTIWFITDKLLRVPCHCVFHWSALKAAVELVLWGYTMKHYRFLKTNLNGFILIDQPGLVEIIEFYSEQRWMTSSLHIKSYLDRLFTLNCSPSWGWSYLPNKFWGLVSFISCSTWWKGSRIHVSYLQPVLHYFLRVALLQTHFPFPLGFWHVKLFTRLYSLKVRKDLVIVWQY